MQRTPLLQITWTEALLERIVYAFLLVGILLSHRLWLSEREFPLVPVGGVFDFAIPLQGDKVLLGMLVIGLVVSIITRRRWVRLCCLGLLCFLLLQDQIRWQPWVFIYVLILLILLIPKRKREIGFYVRLLLTGVYFWSGFYKLNTSFFQSDLHMDICAQAHLGSACPVFLAYAIPVVEMSVGIALLIPILRRYALWMGAALHLGVLVFLGLLGGSDNVIILPWNICMTLLLFYATRQEMYRFNWKTAIRDNLLIATLYIAWMLPALNRFGYPDYLSFKMYTEDISDMFIAVEESALPQISPDVLRYHMDLGSSVTGGKLIDVTRWSMEELHVPIPPEPRIYKAIADHFCALGIPPEKLVFLLYKRPRRNDDVRTFNCGEPPPAMD